MQSYLFYLNQILKVFFSFVCNNSLALSVLFALDMLFIRKIAEIHV